MQWVSPEISGGGIFCLNILVCIWRIFCSDRYDKWCKLLTKKWGLEISGHKWSGVCVKIPVHWRWKMIGSGSSSFRRAAISAANMIERSHPFVCWLRMRTRGASVSRLSVFFSSLSLVLSDHVKDYPSLCWKNLHSVCVCGEKFR